MDAGRLTNLSGGTLTGGSPVFRGTATSAPSGNVTTNATDISPAGPGAAFTGLNALANNQGSLALDAGATLAISGALTNSGSLTVGNGSMIQVAGVLTRTGSAAFLGGRHGTFAAASFTLSRGFGPDPDAIGLARRTTGVGVGSNLTLQGNVMLDPDVAFFLELDTLGGPAATTSPSKATSRSTATSTWRVSRGSVPAATT